MRREPLLRVVVFSSLAAFNLRSWSLERTQLPLIILHDARSGAITRCSRACALTSVISDAEATVQIHDFSRSPAWMLSVVLGSLGTQMSMLSITSWEIMPRFWSEVLEESTAFVCWSCCVELLASSGPPILPVTASVIVRITTWIDRNPGPAK